MTPPIPTHAVPATSPWTACAATLTASVSSFVRVHPGSITNWANVTCAECRAQAPLAFNLYSATKAERDHLRQAWADNPAISNPTR